MNLYMCWKFGFANTHTWRVVPSVEASRFHAGLAQSVERQALNLVVLGSSPRFGGKFLVLWKLAFFTSNLILFLFFFWAVFSHAKTLDTGYYPSLGVQKEQESEKIWLARSQIRTGYTSTVPSPLHVESIYLKAILAIFMLQHSPRWPPPWARVWACPTFIQIHIAPYFHFTHEDLDSAVWTKFGPCGMQKPAWHSVPMCLHPAAVPLMRIKDSLASDNRGALQNPHNETVCPGSLNTCTVV